MQRASVLHKTPKYRDSTLSLTSLFGQMFRPRNEKAVAVEDNDVEDNNVEDNDVNVIPVDDDSRTAEDALRTFGPSQRSLIDLERVGQGRRADVKRGVIASPERKLPAGAVVVIDAGRHQLVESHRVVVA